MTNRGPTDPSVIRQTRRTRQYNAAQLRNDTWNELQVHCSWLHERSRSAQEHEEPRARVAEQLETLRRLEFYWAYPGLETIDELNRLFALREYGDLAARVSEIVRLLIGDAYRGQHSDDSGRRRSMPSDRNDRGDALGRREWRRPYFEVLVVDAIDATARREMRADMLEARRDDDEFIYDVVTVPSFEDAIVAILFNRSIQTCVLRYNYQFHTNNRHDVFQRYLDMLAAEQPRECYGLDRSLSLGRLIKKFRPEIDLFLVTDTPLEEVAGALGRDFRRAFYRLEQHMELHLSILKGIQARHEAPFFEALRRYSQKPTGIFHALPIARAKSMANSMWARDLLEFYGPNIFLAETSATSGGLDSLLQPRGPIKRAQQLAARAFGARETFFVTNGTSTANKIVVQALVRPGDIVLIDRDCHKSHHYALMLAGAMPIYLDSYPLRNYSMYGAVPLEEIKRTLNELKDAGKLDQVRMLLLTNCTFDGITYDPQRVMREVLAIKPDMIFLWDEAWYAFASFSPTLRQRTAMTAAANLREMMRSDSYREAYDRSRAGADDEHHDGHDAIAAGLPDPDLTRVRVYATQSTHKTLTSLRQGSMIHVYDEDFEQKVSGSFHEAFMTHTSTSPNYQIIASLDVGRRQVELEGYELVHRSIGLAMVLRERINEHPLIRKYFQVLRPVDMIPERFRPSGLEFYYDPVKGWERMEHAYRMDELTLDPTRVTIHIGRTGLDGDAMRHLLMDEYDIQINKTSRNTALFMTNIGTTRGDVAYLVEVLAKIAQSIDDRLATESAAGLALHHARVAALTEELPPLPNFSCFHEAFRPASIAETPAGDIRSAFFLAYDDTLCEYLKLDGSLTTVMDAGRDVVSAVFVTPYPPGFPILVPGQVLSHEILEYLHAVDVKEIHGYKPEYGLRVFTERALRRAAGGRVLEHAAAKGS